MERFFVNRPIFAISLAVVIVLLGGISIFELSIEQYPDITPPVVEVSASYNGADAETVNDAVATPVAQSVMGVSDMLYMQTTSSNDGSMVLQVTFEVGSDPDLDAIYEYSGVLAAHTPDIDRLESSDSAIVLQLYATEDTYRIGHILCGFQPFPGYAVRWGSPLCPVRQHCRDRQTVGSGRCPGGKGQRCGCQHA